MSAFSLRSQTLRGAVRGYIVAALVLLLVPVWLCAEAPAWWAQRGVLNPAATADDYAVVNQGQVKHIALKAYEEFEGKLPDGAGSALDATWSIPAASADDYVAINIGQLKNLAKPFYDRLIAGGLAVGYPWSGGSADDYALANIGQVKNVFSFNVPIVTDPTDADGDGMLDSWEVAHFVDLHITAGGNADGDALSNRAEYLAGTNPTSAATAVSPSVLSLKVYSP